MGAEPMGAEPMGAEPMGAEPMGAEPMGAEPMGAEPMGAEPMSGRLGARAAGATGAASETVQPAPESLLALAVEIAVEAGDLALRARAAGRASLEAGMLRKSSRTDLATDADRAVEELIRRRIAEARPEDAVLGEEAGGRAGSSGLIWVVDPIDGTTNFVYDFPSFAVSIAVAEELGTTQAQPSWPAPLDELLGVGRILAGVVRDPARGETFTAALGAGASLNGAPLAVDDSALELGEALVGTGFGYTAEKRRAQAAMLTTVLPGVRDLRRAGSASLDVCYVAAGRLDGYYEAEVHAWDVAAGVLVASEAGAACSALAGLPPGSLTMLVCRRVLTAPLADLLRTAAVDA